MFQPSTPFDPEVSPAPAVPPSPTPSTRSDISDVEVTLEKAYWEAGLKIVANIFGTDSGLIDVPGIRAYIDGAKHRWDPNVVSAEEWLAGVGEFSAKQEERLLMIETHLRDKVRQTVEMKTLLDKQGQNLEARNAILTETRENLLVREFGWHTVPARLHPGEEIEQPFGYDENFLDLDRFCQEILAQGIESLKRAVSRRVPEPELVGPVLFVLRYLSFDLSRLAFNTLCIPGGAMTPARCTPPARVIVLLANCVYLLDSVGERSHCPSFVCSSFRIVVALALDLYPLESIADSSLGSRR
ncbi:hypothetical protein B0H13DRAFT_2377104 [Mycena leptocephala]|nr:hypothetical protein B0H13DRAFT_2377104 [Mycena leptocephala]